MRPANHNNRYDPPRWTTDNNITSFYIYLIFNSDQRCHTDVFLMSTNIMDRFLAQVKLPKRQFQLLGAASIFLASKMVEPSPISALTLIKCTADTYDREELLVSSLILGGLECQPNA